MEKKELIEEIKQKFRQGVLPEKIKDDLLLKGWTDEEINEGFKGLFSSPSQEFKENNQPAPKKRKIQKIGLLALALIIIAGGAYSSFKFFMSSEAIAKKAFANLLNYESVEYSGEIEFKNVSEKIIVNFEGASNIKDINNPMSKNSITLSYKEMEPIGLEAKIINKNLYARLTSLPETSFFDFSYFQDQWIKFDLKDYQDDSTLTNEQEKELLIESNIVKITERLPDEKINTDTCYHFRFILDKENIKNLVFNFSEISGEYSKEDVSDLKSKIDNSLKSAQGELFIKKSDLMPYKITFSLDLEEGELDLNLVFNNFNEEIQIEAPEETLDIMSLFENTLTPLDNARKIARDARRKSDLQQISLAMELYYNINNAYLDTKAGVDSVATIGTYLPVVPTDPIDSDSYQYTWLNGNSKYYCVYATLEDPDSAPYYCVSSHGMSESYKTPTLNDCCGFNLTD